MRTNRKMLRCKTDVEHKFAKHPLASIDESGTFSGYASLFDTVDLGSETVAKGAFAKSIARKSVNGVRLLFQHNPDEPIGRWIEITEDNTGLYVKGQLNLDVARAREVHSLMLTNSIDGLSIGFKTVRSRREKGGQVRRILEADLWEISIVTFPMLPQARVAQVKANGELPSRREFEHWLVRDAGLSRGQAKTVIVKGFAALGSARDAADSELETRDETQVQLVRKIRRAARHFMTN